MGLVRSDHTALARWASDCAAHVLPHFERQRPDDDRPRAAIATARAWSRGEVHVGEARAAAFAADAAARATDVPAARAAARAAGHAAATVHIPTQAGLAAAYAATAVTRAADPADEGAFAREREWQLARLPKSLRPFTEAGGR